MYSRTHQDRERYWSEYIIIGSCKNQSLSARLIRYQKHGMDSAWSQSKSNNQNNILLLFIEDQNYVAFHLKALFAFVSIWLDLLPTILRWII